MTDYTWKPEFIAKPAEGAVERDWTDKILVTEITNSLGETFTFENGPEVTLKDAKRARTRDSDDPGSKDKDEAVNVWIQLPLC